MFLGRLPVRRLSLSLAIAAILSVAAHADAIAEAETTTNSTALDKGTALDKVVVEGERVRETEPSQQAEKLINLPGSMGDPLQAIYSLPGIVQTQEIGGAPAVRGSGPDDNAFLIDFLPAGYVFHDFGFSIFNENLLQDFGLKSAGFGSRYGKATGAVFDVRLRNPRQQPWQYTLESSFLRVGVFGEGEFTDSQAMYFSVRESLLHLLLKLRADTIEEEEDISFDQYPRARDAQIKYSWAVDANNRLTALLIGAQDSTTVSLGSESDIALIDPGVEGDARLMTRFVSEGLMWTFDDGPNRLQTAVGHLADARHISSGNGSEYSNTDTDTFTLKSHYDRKLGNSHGLGIGAEYQRARYDYDLNFRYRSCTNYTPDCRVNRGPLITIRSDVSINSIEAFAEDRWQIAKPLALTIGAHFTQNDYLDESHVEPRVASEWQVTRDLELHASWGIYHQLPRVGQIIPTLGNPMLESPSATHYVVGFKHQYDALWSWSTDVYYKTLDNLVVDVTTGEQYVNGATGKAYGAEFMINKNRDALAPIRGMNRVYGWFALSLSKAKRLNETNGLETIFEFDTPAIANLVLNYQIARSWDVGLRWQLRSGLPYTPIVSNKPNPNFPGFYLPVYGELNSARASPYHRLDLRGEYQLKTRKINGSVYFDIINAYARRNGGEAQYKPIPGTSEYYLEERETLPLLPSIGIKVTFK